MTHPGPQPTARPHGLSKSKLLSYRQCARRLWLEIHRRDLAEDSPQTQAAFAMGHAVGDIAQTIYGGGRGQRVPYEPGLRQAIALTQQILADGGDEPVFEATFEHDGVLVRVDVLLRKGGRYRLVEVKASTRVKDVHLVDCAVQAWVLEREGIELDGIALAHINRDFVYPGDGDYSGLLVEEDVSRDVHERLPQVGLWVEHARELLGDAEPDVPVGLHCSDPYDCPFYEHCAPKLGLYPVTGLGGRREKLFEWMHEGYTDLRDVPEDRLTPSQQRIFEVTVRGEAELGPGALEFARGLALPRYYLDFETIGFAVPIWAGTRPYEALPFQWSCHIEEPSGRLRQAEFLDLTGDPPMRPCAEALIAALGSEGPILVYTGYEARIIRGLIQRYPDLQIPLEAIHERLVDLHPATRSNYYHPDMLGSWSLKAVIPTIAPDLDYEDLDEVQDGTGAQVAYQEAIDPTTSSARREALRRSMLDYCGYDTLAMVQLLDFFLGSARKG